MPPNGVYVLTPQWYPDRPRLLEGVRAALEGGAAMVQFRDKSDDALWRLETALGLQALCSEYRIPLVINDDIALAKACGAAGVHLGRNDEDPDVARSELGDRALIGISCYDRYDRAVTAAAAGADYLAFGSVYPSATKPEAVRCGLDTLSAARQLGLPLVAIGGITPENGAAPISAGADFLAVISAVFDREDISAATREFAALWQAG